jgi:hypothetical protein
MKNQQESLMHMIDNEQVLYLMQKQKSYHAAYFDPSKESYPRKQGHAIHSTCHLDGIEGESCQGHIDLFSSAWQMQW